MGVRLGDSREHTLARMSARQTEHTLNEANGADATGGKCGVGPLFEGRTDALALADEPIDKRLLPRGSLGLTRARRKDASRDAHVDQDERIGLENAHQLRIPLHADALAEKGERYGIERAAHFDMPIGVDGPLASGEERKGGAGEWLQRPLLDLDEMRPNLTARGAVNAQARNGAIPVAEERIMRIEAVKRSPFQRIVFDVPAAAFLLSVFLRRARRVGKA